MTSITNAESLGILGLSEGATADEIKQAWRRLAMTAHPDRGGSVETFNRIQAAYEEATTYANKNGTAAGSCSICKGSGRMKNPSQRGFYANFEVMCVSCRGSGKQK